MNALPTVLTRWHELLESADPSGLQALLADDVVFRSPAVHTPQEGKAIVFAYLSSAMTVLTAESFEYVDQWVRERSAILEFVAVVDGLQVHGIDMIEWNDDDLITKFTVMVRPLKALNALVARMVEQLQKQSS